MSVWQDIPFTFKMESKVESIDIAMKKVVWTKDKDCGSPDNSKYIGKLISKRQNILINQIFIIDE